MLATIPSGPPPVAPGHPAVLAVEARGPVDRANTRARIIPSRWTRLTSVAPVATEAGTVSRPASCCWAPSRQHGPPHSFVRRGAEAGLPPAPAWLARALFWRATRASASGGRPCGRGAIRLRPGARPGCARACRPPAFPTSPPQTWRPGEARGRAAAAHSKATRASGEASNEPPRPSRAKTRPPGPPLPLSWQAELRVSHHRHGAVLRTPR
eukprot:scaffold5884_cov110-Isochrysis_galbana.AAC.1